MSVSNQRQSIYYTQDSIDTSYPHSENTVSTDHRHPDDRAQLATSLIESGVGALLILAVVSGFLWAPGETTGSTAELDQLAADTLHILEGEIPSSSEQSYLMAMCDTSSTIMTEQTLLRDRVSAILPPTVFAQIKTPHGTIGPAVPVGGHTGQAVSIGSRCTVAIEVWYV